MKNIAIVFALALITNIIKAQTTAMNFNRKDCDGNTQNLFADLNSGKAVIVEFVMMSCGSCVTAGQALEPMKANLLQQYPGKIKSYAISFNNSTSCATIKNWVTANGFTSLPMDSGATQVAYYGGMGMPTIVILGGGTNHSVLGSPYVGFSTSDTTTMANDIRNSLNILAGVKENKSLVNALNIFPNPANNEFKISFNIIENTELKIDVIDITGRNVLTLMNEKVQTGNFNRTFDTGSLAQGNYIIRINAGGTITQQKLSVIH